MPVINSTRGIFGSQSSLLAIGGEQTLEFLLFGAGGGSGSSNRVNEGYRTSVYYRTKEGGAGGVVYGSYKIKKGTSIGFSVGGGGRGGGQQGNPSDASGGYNGGGGGTYGQYDMSGGGGGYTAVFVSSVGKNQNGIIALAPGGGGGGGGPGYPANVNGQANGGGGITTNGVGNAGTRQYGYYGNIAGGGTLTSGGVGGDATSNAPTGGDGQSGSALTGANAYHWRNAWGSGGGGGAGWFGGGSGANDGDSWDGGGGGAGSAFIRGSGLSYNAAGLTAISGVTYTTHTFYTQTYGTYGDGSNPVYSASPMSTPSGALNSMRMPVETTNQIYPGNTIAYGGIFNNAGTGAFAGVDGRPGAIVYRINGGAWTTVSYSGSDTTLSL
jgi:hypothetical protein